MRRFRNILLAYGGKPVEEPAILRAVALAVENQARLTVFSVVNDLNLAIVFIPAYEFIRKVSEDYRGKAEGISDTISQEEFVVNTKVVVGTPFLEIIRQVLREEHDLVVMASEGTGGPKQLPESTSMQLMRKCPCPVWIVRPRSRPSYSRIVAAVDPRPDDQVRYALSQKIMALATSLARREGSELHIVHAWGPTLESHQLGHPIDEMLGYKCHNKRLQELLDGFEMETIKAHIHLLDGDPDSIILKVVENITPELVVMGTVCRTGLAGFFIGNTAESVLNKVACSVLTVKPDGFETPVTIEANERSQVD